MTTYRVPGRGGAQVAAVVVLLAAGAAGAGPVRAQQAGAPTGAAPVVWSWPAQGASVRAPDVVTATYDADLYRPDASLHRVLPDGSRRWLSCRDRAGLPLVRSVVECVPPQPLADGVYEIEVAHVPLDGPAMVAYAAPVTFTVDSTADPVPSLVVHPIALAQAAAALASGAGPDGDVVSVSVTDAAGGVVTGQVPVQRGRWEAALDLRPLRDGLLEVVVRVEGSSAAATRARVLKDTDVPRVVAFQAPVLAQWYSTYTWSAHLSEPSVRAKLLAVDRLGTPEPSWTAELERRADAAGRTTPGLVDGVGWALDGPLRLTLRLRDRVGNEALVPVGTVEKEVVPSPSRAWERLRAAGHHLGPAVAPERTEQYCGGTGTCETVRGQAYAGGEVWSSPLTGGHEVHGAILEEWRRLGGAGGALGPPMSDEEVVGSGRRSRFRQGDVYWSSRTGAHVVAQPVAALYRAAGGADGVLGFPTGPEALLAGPVAGPLPVAVRVTPFEDGRVFRTEGMGDFTIAGPEYRRWLAGGGAALLGVPVTAQRPLPGGAGVREFSGGAAVYSSPVTGTAVVRGAILARYRGLERLGLPLSDEQALVAGPHDVLRISRFERGAIVWSGLHGAHVVEGEILRKYLQPGIASRVGPPLTDEHVGGTEGGRASTFARGSVFWSPTTGTHEMHGGIAATWKHVNDLAGGYPVLGLPVTDEYVVRGEPRSDFQRGRIRWTTAGPIVTYPCNRWGCYVGPPRP